MFFSYSGRLLDGIPFFFTFIPGLVMAHDELVPHISCVSFCVRKPCTGVDGCDVEGRAFAWDGCVRVDTKSSTRTRRSSLPRPLHLARISKLWVMRTTFPQLGGFVPIGVDAAATCVWCKFSYRLNAHVAFDASVRSPNSQPQAISGMRCIRGMLSTPPA